MSATGDQAGSCHVRPAVPERATISSSAVTLPDRGRIHALADVISRPKPISFHVALGDLPTRLLALFALGALLAAGFAYWEQRKAGRDLAEQVRLQGEALEHQRTASAAVASQAEAQRDALTVQQETGRVQGKVLQAELSDLRQRARALERQQARHDHSHCLATSVGLARRFVACRLPLVVGEAVTTTASAYGPCRQ